MTEALSTLAQLAPPATILSSLYTVPALTMTTISSIVVCNMNNATVKFRISVAVAGAADDPKQYLYYDLSLTKFNTFIATVGITLGAGDVVRVQTDTLNVGFNAFGVQIV